MTDYAVQQQPASRQAEPVLAQGGSSKPGAGRPGRRAIRAAHSPLSPARAAVVATLVGLAALALWFVVYAVAFSGLQEDHTQHLLYTELRSNLAQATVPFGGVIAPGTPIAYIDAGAIGLHAVVVEGTSSADLAKGPGHLPDSPLPGQAGNSEIYGRSTMFGAPFGSVHDLRKGAIIAVTTGQGTFDFRVLDVRGPGDPIPSAAQFGQSSLTLVTSAGSGWTNGWTNEHVIYADATLAVGKMQGTPSGRPTAVPAIDKPLAGDSGELVPVVLWLEALVVVSAGLAFAYIRWTTWQVWVVGLPALLAVLWATTGVAMLLLPNLV